MKKADPQVLLVFYPSQLEEVKQVGDRLRKKAGLKPCLCGAGSQPESWCFRYDKLRLDGETLLAVRCTTEEANAAIRIVQASGSPAIFLLQEGLTAAEEVVQRQEPLSGEALKAAIHEVAVMHGTPLRSGATKGLRDRLRESDRILESATDELAQFALLDRSLTAAAEWLFDNGYLARSSVTEVLRHLPREHHRELPSLPQKNGSLRIYELSKELLQHTDGGLTQANITESIREYQTLQELTIGEIWVLPVMLRMVLVESLAQLANQVSHAQYLREAAYLWANRLAQAFRHGPEAYERMLALLESDPVATQSAFVTCLDEQLQGEEPVLGPIERWLEARLARPLPDIVRRDHELEAGVRLSVANAFGSLRALGQMDAAKLFESTSLVELELRRDPAGTYPGSAFATRNQCRSAIEDLARNSALFELEVAKLAIQLASEASDPSERQVEYYLLDAGIEQIERKLRTDIPFRKQFARSLRKRPTPIYLVSINLLTLSFLALTLAFAWEGGVQSVVLLSALAALAFFPLSELSVQFVNALVISLLPPDELPRMDYEKGIPESGATLVVVPMMLSSLAVVQKELEKLEVRYLGNREKHLSFALFSDFLDAPTATTPADDGLLRAAVEGIDELNHRYPETSFALFHRDRKWSESEQAWIGWERKRGKIEELNAYLCGDHEGNVLRAGRLRETIHFVITLDADTTLPTGAARRMIETIAHPLNRVEIEPVTRRRLRGFTIIQPRISISLPGATATRFTRVFSDATGTDPYCHAVSDAQQDLFGEGIFHGKAIYDVAAFHAMLGHRFPDATLLSHDLIEGAFVGVGLASGIELFENLPLDYSSFSKRQHRWIRGDWQISPWMRSTVPAGGGGREPNTLSLANRWRILDNLRRSLVPIASFLLLVFGWLISAAPGLWSLVVGLALATPALAPLLERAVRRIQGTVHGWRGASDELIRAVVLVALLPHQAWLSLDAIVRVIYRRQISHRHLLEWQTAEMAHAKSAHHVSSLLRQLMIVSACSLAMMIALIMVGSFAPTFLFLALWVLSPAIAVWLAHSGAVSPLRSLPATDRLFLRKAARETWRFFDDLVGTQSNWLPPDNSQVSLRIEVAQRTSPTNIGLWLASATAARDFGYLTIDEFERRCAATMHTIERLEHYEGHLLNWYDTHLLEPLLPRYVSTVDSGNLLASLWILEQGVVDALRGPVLPANSLRGLSDTLSVLAEASGRDTSFTVPLRTLQRLFRGGVTGSQLISRLRLAREAVRQLTHRYRWQVAQRDDRSYWVEVLERDVEFWIAGVERYLLWLETLADPPDQFVEQLGPEAVLERRRLLRRIPSLADFTGGMPAPLRAFLDRPGGLPQVQAWLDQIESEWTASRAAAVATSARLQALFQSTSNFANGINMAILYDSSRRLFGIGYSVGGPLEFTSHYDLLASECRLTSYVAVAKGDVPMDHWFALGRPHPVASGGEGLLSWSGTMFEYLMPMLFMPAFANSMLDRACRYAVDTQMEYGRERGVPWGVSESAYSALDAHQIYQYRAFGVPDLGLQPGLEKELVVAPYATMLALQVEPVASVENLRRLKELGMVGSLGFYESIDYTRQSTREGGRGVVVYTYMAHHQAMSLLALDNAVHGNAMQRRFQRNLRVRAVESLLFEGLPVSRSLIEEQPRPKTAVRASAQAETESAPWQEESGGLRVHLYGNGRLSSLVNNSGGGYTRWNDFDISRWRMDSSPGLYGPFIYVRDVAAKTNWSVTIQPTSGRVGVAFARFTEDRVEFQRRVLGIETVTEVTVASEDDVEIRRVTITNRSLRRREIELTSYVELALAVHGADRAHPAFAKMFVETERLENAPVLIAHRRPRSPDETPIWAAHILIGAAEVQFETDRGQFLGRGNTLAHPAALDRELTGSAGAVLDPIFSLRCRLKLEPRDRAEISYLTIAASSREALLALVQKYSAQETVGRAFEMAWTRSQLQFRYLGISGASAERFQDLLGYIYYPIARLRAPDRILRNKLGQPQLWGHGISGDLPIVTVLVGDARGLRLVRELLLAHTYWRLRGFRADLVILNQEPSSYDRPLANLVRQMVEGHTLHTGVEQPGGVFLRDWNAISEVDRDLLLASASIVLNGGRGTLRQQLTSGAEAPVMAQFVPSDAATYPSSPLPFLQLPYFNGLGGFTTEGHEYAIYLKPESQTPAPWVNVIATENFGTVVSESGLGFTWFGNSQSNRLTPWHNDPVTDPQSEAIYLRDEDTGTVWTPTALPIRENDAYRARHGQGYSVFEHNSHAIVQELTVFVPTGQDPVKICRLKLRNESGRPRKLTATYFVEWVLGSTREEQQLQIHTAWDQQSGAMVARNSWNSGFGTRVAFAAASPQASSFSGDRFLFLGRNGSHAKPEGLDRVRLENRAGAGMDPAGILQVEISLDTGKEAEVIFLLGEAESIEQVRKLTAQYKDSKSVENALAATRDWWNLKLSVITVKTPTLSNDLLMNRWLQYQTLSCRFWARSAIYQSGGAFGFRDQLQDCLALVYSMPEVTRAHILKCASRQFVEGDVQHWWHPESGNGVRTKCSDDLAWLPFAVARYAEITGDVAILDEQVTFLEGPILKEDEHEKLFVPNVSHDSANLLEHCRRALEYAWKLGPHGLPLFGNGDWNDGMNLVGAAGKGESSWLAWFLCASAKAFDQLLSMRGYATEPIWKQRATNLAEAMERDGWDGQWYLRGYFDDGSKLGASANAEARIDSIPQSWAVISGSADPDRARQALRSAQRELVLEKERLILLFTPPFDRSQPNPGYIMGYPAGVRENGGQYTHASLWFAMACARIADGASAVRMLEMINPIERASDVAKAAKYRGEPYVIAADIAALAGHVGQSGWTWYTGSSGVMYRAWIEDVLGFHLRGDHFTMEPAIPETWPGFSFTYRYRSATYQIAVERSPEGGAVEVDGTRVESGRIQLKDDGRTHSVRIRIAGASAVPMKELAEFTTRG